MGDVLHRAAVHKILVEKRLRIGVVHTVADPGYMVVVGHKESAVGNLVRTEDTADDPQEVVPANDSADDVAGEPVDMETEVVQANG